MLLGNLWYNILTSTVQACKSYFRLRIFTMLRCAACRPVIHFITSMQQYSINFLLFQEDFFMHHHITSETSNHSASSTFSNYEWHSATGPLAIPMTNDYLFRALLQTNSFVLKGLIGALLHLAPWEIISATINNPIQLGESIDDKSFLLDVSVTLNNHSLINLEMQVINEHNWPERSLSYLCRTFDNLKPGQDYIDVRPTFQIGLLNFTLFPEYPEFYSIYRFMNIKNHIIYSDKIQLSVLDLTCIHLATEEDKRYHLDDWASLFKAVTWEELKMLSKRNEFINEASNTVYRLSQEEQIRLQCEAREDYYRRQLTVQNIMKRQEEQIAQLTSEKAALEKQLSDALKTVDTLTAKGNG